MIIFLYGFDSYGRQKKIKEITEQYRKKNPDLEIERFDFGEFDFDSASDKKAAQNELARFANFFQSPTLFAQTKLAIAENIFAIINDSAKNKKLFKKLLKENLENKDFVLIISEEKKPAATFDFLLKKPALTQEFKELKGKDWLNFVDKEIKNRDVPPAAKNYLIKNFEGDGWGFINELEKLTLAKNILEHIDSVNTIENFFDQVRELIYSRSLAQKIPQLEILLSQNDSAKIFNLLASFSTNPLSLTRKFADYDVLIKSGKIDYEEALLDLIL